MGWYNASILRPRRHPRGIGEAGMQKIDNTGSLTIKRMGTIDDEFSDTALTGVDTQAKAGKQFCYCNSTRIFSHLKSESEGKTGYGLEADGVAGARRTCRVVLKKTRRSRHRQQHDGRLSNVA